jgi:hypothetical protein
MFVTRDVAQVLALVSEGYADTVIARITGIPRSTIREWRIGRVPGATTVTGLDGRVRACPICIPGSIELPPAAYAYLFGLYLGDGCITKAPRTYRLRFFLDAAYPGIVVACRAALEAVRPGQHALARPLKATRCYEVGMYSSHWPCLLPQHGPGRKHQRRIALAEWQEAILDGCRREFVRGLIHSDGCRIVANDRCVKSVRYHFSNKSEDIKALYCESLDALGVRWTRPCDRQIAVYRKSSVAILECFIGPKR